MKALIVANGTIDSKEILIKYAKYSDLIICADGGAKHLTSVGLYPHILIGDLDSIEKRTLDQFISEGVELIRFPTKKDQTDTELSIEYAVDKGSKEIVLLGCTGSRLDHTLGNIMLLEKISKLGQHGKVVDGVNEIFLVSDHLTLENTDDSYVSLISLNENSSIVSLVGFEYNLSKAVINRESTQGISNKIVSDIGEVTVHEGICLVIRSRDK